MDNLKKKNHYRQSQSKNKINDDERRLNDRRLCTKKGFTYITMVGWMCRREKTRRKGDHICGW